MALFDRFRRRRNEGAPQRSGWLRGIIDRVFNRKKRPEPMPAYEPAPEPAEMDDITIDDSLVDAVEDVNVSPAEMPAEPDLDLSPVTPVDDRTLVDRYGQMLDTMVEKGYIQPFDTDRDAAEFLRVLSSDAWEEAHNYWYSVEALQQIQDAIQRGATAGGLQEEYTKQTEKKSKNYLLTWENWLRVVD